MNEMSEACRELCTAVQGMSVDDVADQIAASSREIRDPRTLAAYLLSMPPE